MAYDDGEDQGGMGLAGFLDHDTDAFRSGGGDWLPDWKKAKQIDIWLHLLGVIRMVYNHQFIIDIETDEKNTDGEKTGRKKHKLAWPRFISPDGGLIHENQYFRDDRTGILRELFNRDAQKRLRGGSEATAFMSDPFLILREYLHHAVDRKLLDPNAVLFEWVDHKNVGEMITWRVGECSRHTKRGFKNRGHSLDTKLEYIFAVVQHEKPEEGAKIARTSKLLGDLMRKEIKRQIESKGVEAGDPTKTPYCFRWKYIEDASSPMNSYEAYRIDQNECTVDIWQAIGGAPDEAQGESWDIVPAPDTRSLAEAGDGDMDKIRQAFESAGQIDLPLDAIFSEDWEERRRCVTGEILRDSTARVSSSSSATAPTRPNPGAAPGAQRPGAPARPAAQAAPAPARTVATPAPGRTVAAAAPAPAAAAPAPTAAAAPSGPQPRRKKVEAAAPPPPPKPAEPERMKCDDCDEMLLPTDAKCPGCGAEYDIDAAPPLEEVAAAPEPAAAPAPAPAAARRPPPKTAEELEDAQNLAEAKCFACGAQRIVREEDPITKKVIAKCGNCGMDQGDDLPFG